MRPSLPSVLMSVCRRLPRQHLVGIAGIRFHLHQQARSCTFPCQSNLLQPPPPSMSAVHLTWVADESPAPLHRRSIVLDHGAHHHTTSTVNLDLAHIRIRNGRGRRSGYAPSKRCGSDGQLRKVKRFLGGSRQRDSALPASRHHSQGAQSRLPAEGRIAGTASVAAMA